MIVNNTRELTKPDSHWLRVPPSLAALEDNPKIEKVGAINVQLPPYWDSMWATYFLWGHKLYMQNPSYYPITEPGRGGRSSPLRRSRCRARSSAP